MKLLQTEPFTCACACVQSDAPVVYAALHHPGLRLFGQHINNNYSNIAASSNEGVKHNSSSYKSTQFNIKLKTNYLM